jgi:hypothetical protein
MKVYIKNRGTAPLILNFSTTWRTAISFMPWLLYLQERDPLHWRGAQMGTRDGRTFHRTETFLAPARNLTVHYPVYTLVTTLTTLSSVYSSYYTNYTIQCIF